MDFLPLHPKLVHLPIALAVLMPLLSLGVWVAWWKSWLPRRSWVLVIAFQALLVATGVAALRSGEQDEERVEKVVSERLIKAHEEAAEVFVWGSAAVLALTLAAGLLRAEKPARALAAAAVVGTLGVFGLGYRTGSAGGGLVYQHGAASAFTGTAAGGATAVEGGGGDKDGDGDGD